MSTGYKIELGYNSGAIGMGDWSDLKECALEICENPGWIFDEAIDGGAPENSQGESLMEFCIAFKKRDDLTIQFDDGEEHIFMIASGSNPARAMKEHCRRAFIRFLMKRMHLLGVDISVIVS